MPLKTTSASVKNKLLEFMTGHKISNEEKTYSHIVGNKKYLIPDTEYQKFIELYLELILTRGNIVILEKHNEYPPMHFEFYYDSSEFNEASIKKIVNTCNSFLKYYFKITSRMMACFIIKSDASIKIFYPLVCLKPSLIRIIVEDLIFVLKIEINLDSIYKDDQPLYGSIFD